MRHYRTAEGRAWDNMKSRCYNPKVDQYSRYGGRGIRVCDRWLNSFDAFYKDMGAKPSPKHSIDRIDNDGDYTPENCRWATTTEQNLNQRVRVDNKLKIKGIHFQGTTFVAKYRGIYLGRFQDLKDAVAARRKAESGTIIE